MNDGYEKETAAYEAERNRAWHSWFAARGHISPTDEHTLIFDGGFRMAWEFCRAQPAPGEWQPIETAPKDGTHIQLYRPVMQFVGYYGGEDSGWRHNAPGLDAIWPLPTHWMPLPPTPSEQQL